MHICTTGIEKSIAMLNILLWILKMDVCIGARTSNGQIVIPYQWSLFKFHNEVLFCARNYLKDLNASLANFSWTILFLNSTFKKYRKTCIMLRLPKLLLRITVNVWKIILKHVFCKQRNVWNAWKYKKVWNCILEVFYLWRFKVEMQFSVYEA